MEDQQKESPDESVDIESFEPDYETPCVNCGERPTVTAVKGGMIVHHVELCGPCCWGTSEALDPDTWN